MHEIYKNKINNTFLLDYARLNVYHLYHGTAENRKYVVRHEIFNNFISQKRLNSIFDLVNIRDDGIYEWKDIYKKEMNSKILEYFVSRNDDGI